MMKAAIDIGSNSILLSICKVEAGELRELVSGSTVTGLGRDLDRTGLLHPQARALSLSVLKNYRDQIVRHQIPSEGVVVTGTEVLRAAKDAAGFIKGIEELLGVPLTLLTGEGEAYYTAMGVANSKAITDSDIFIMDMGGASTELIHFNKRERVIEKTVSLPAGAARATMWLHEDNIESKMGTIYKEFDLKGFHTKRLLCVAGSMTTIAAMIAGQVEFSASELEGKLIPAQNFFQFCDRLLKLSEEEITRDFPIASSRIKTVQSGASVAASLFRHLQVDELVISTFGLRHGIISAEVIDERFKIRK